jgi:uncharacterized DUF497 family protein
MTMFSQKFEWDPAKNQENLRKHGIRFEEAMLVFDGPILTRIDSRFGYGEIREISIGNIKNITVVVVVHTQRDTKIRLISARIANKTERNLYHVHFAEKD